MSTARRLHLLVAVVALVALALQLALVVRGGQVLAEVEPPGLAARLARFVAYFTIQSNALVAGSAVLLARAPDRDGPGFRVLRLAAIVGISVTGVVHFLLLRPLLDLHGADWAADKLLHMVVPVLAIGTWVAVGPRPRVDRRAALGALAWPVAWLAVTLVVGAVSGWYPYPFLDHREDGVAAVVVVCLAITVFFVALLAGAAWLDRRLRPAPRSPTETR